jgi:iron complex transport system substrate-binding protein
MIGTSRGASLAVAVLAFILLCLWGQPAHAQGISVVDDRGVTVRLPRAPQRIVTLLPSITESVCALGACKQIVATDRWSNWPASVQALPKLGGLDDANVELIVAQRPDLVLVAPSSRVAPRLRALGLTVAELNAQDLSQVQKFFGKIATLIGQPQAAEILWQALQAEIDEARDQVPFKARGVRVYFEVAATPYAAGAASFIGQLLARLGAVNVVPAELGPFPKLNPEFIVRSKPDLIMIAAYQASGLAARPGWSRMRAVAGRRVCALSPADYDLLARPGPRLGQGAAVLARCLESLVAKQPGAAGASR